MTSALANQAIIDTSIYIDNFRYGKYKEELVELKFIVRASAVVLAELGRGIRSEPSKKLVQSLAKNLRIITPEEADWLLSGPIVSELVQKYSYDKNKLREIHFDVLIALSARRIGAYLITSNRQDFEAIRKVKPFKVIYWP